MKKIFALLLVLFANNSYANWQLIDKNSQYELYINSNSMVKTTQGFRFTWLYNYYEQNRSGTKKSGYYTYQSYSFDEEINCLTKESRLFSSSPFSEPMGRGLITVNTMNGKWMSVYHKIKGAGIQTIFSKLCR
jgi:hypothetical protein